MDYKHDFVHRSIDSIKPTLDSGVESLPKKEWLKIVQAFDQFHHTLKHHIQKEDAILFEKAQNYVRDNSAFYSLIAEHLLIMETLKDCNSMLKQNARQNFYHFFNKLVILIEEHAIREEALLMVDLSQLEGSAQEIIRMLRDIHSSGCDGVSGRQK